MRASDEIKGLPKRMASLETKLTGLMGGYDKSMDKAEERRGKAWEKMTSSLGDCNKQPDRIDAEMRAMTSLTGMLADRVRALEAPVVKMGKR